jgi:hypothetical protein
MIVDYTTQKGVVRNASIQGPVVQRNFVTILALSYLGIKSTGPGYSKEILSPTWR